MTNIVEYLKTEVFLPRLRQKGCLVVYDADGLFKPVCQSLASATIEVIDTGTSGIESREQSIQNLRRIGTIPPEIEGFIVYVPGPAPTSEQERQADPYALYAECGGLFPDGPTDDFEQICLRGRPDHATEIRRLFSGAGVPTFAAVDAIGGGLGWPRLRSLFGVDSATDITIALLCPNEVQTKALNADTSWIGEAKAFLASALGLEIGLANPSLDLLAIELWRFLLFSEFAFDLPGDLPASLGSIPCAPQEAKAFVESVCERLRNDQRCRARYVEGAKVVEKDLGLSIACAEITELGLKDTFPFEERAFLKKAGTLLGAGNFDEIRPIVQRHSTTVWMDQGENRAQWDILVAAWRLLESCTDLEREMPNKAGSLDVLSRFYTDSFRQADQLHRELEQSLNDPADIPVILSASITASRGAYRRLSSRLQSMLAKLVESSGWPIAGWLSNTSVFDKLVAPYLKERGRKVAFFMVDALRYELGHDLFKRLSQDMPVEISASCAPLPSITTVGMAALVPGAQDHLTLLLEGTDLRPLIKGAQASSVKERMSFFDAYGDRFAHRSLAEFISDPVPLPGAIELIVLRSKDIDSTLESATELNLAQLPRTLKQIRQALAKLKAQGFVAAVIAADHGFQLNFGADAGDVCAKPAGNWPFNAHDRMLLGNGEGGAANLVLPAASLGIKSDTIASAATPRSLAPYSSGRLYFHGGLSFQEAIVPVLTVNLVGKADSDARSFTIKVSYKGGAKLISSRMPIIDIELRSVDLFTAQGDPVEVLIEAQTKGGKVVGEAKPGGEVDPATRTIRLEPGAQKQLIVLMDEEYEGKFKLKALNPTTMATYDAIDLETDYLV